MTDADGSSVADLGELELIERLRRRFGQSGFGITRGIGDDTAVLRPTPGYLLLATTDASVEGTHFLLSSISARDLGRRALAVNLSDIAAMGGLPRWCLVSLGLPGSTRVSIVEQLAEGLAEEAARYDTVIVGGNLARSPDRLIVDVTLLGEVEHDSAMYRDGARPGDRILVSGTLGDSAAGLAILLGHAPADHPDGAFLVGRHHRPTPRVAAGRAIVRAGGSTSMIDLSDGLATDLGHIAHESRVGATVLADQIPLSAELRAVARAAGRDPYEWALRGGEDYELLLTAPADRVAALVDAGSRVGVGLTVVGEITAGNERWLVRGDGSREPLGSVQWRHFGVE